MYEEEINATLISIQQFKIAYSNENGVITVGDIKDLMANIDTIEKCVRKQKRIPTTNEREFGLLGKSKIVHRCSICGSNIYILQIHIVLNVGRNFVCEVLDLIEELMK